MEQLILPLILTSKCKLYSPQTFSQKVSASNTYIYIYMCGTGLKTGIAQLVECLTKKPDTIQMWVWVPGMAREFSPRVNFQCRLWYGVCTAPVCNHIPQCLAARVWKCKNAVHTDRKWVALLLRLLCLTQERWPKFPTRDKGALKIYIQERVGWLWEQCSVSGPVHGIFTNCMTAYPKNE